MVRVLFLGRLEQAAGAPERALDVAAPLELSRLIEGLDPALREAVSAPSIRVALNGVLLSDPYGAMVGPGDEVAFLPPVSGG
ncbi:MoaD/ThiS family protein [Novosphingobium lentum]|uniref:MoaD/ThiS family protein n=1 Tax=Novosphingobium lentum TaxID=145287 RepID=UPI00082DCDD2|nr:MoaD/ThiS family protein [Novosphingobium lentum]